MAKEWIIEPAESTPIASTSENIKRIGAGAGLQALKGIESLATFLPGLIGITPPEQLPSQIISEQSPEYFEPQNIGERYLYRLAEVAPGSALLGGLKALPLSAAGSGAATLLGEAGFPEQAQDIAQLGTEVGLGLGFGKIPTIKSVKKVEDSLARLAVTPATQISGNSIINAMNKVEELLTTETSEPIKKQIKHAMETIGNNFTREKINPVKAMDLRKSLYKLGNKLDPDIAANYIQPLTKSINDFFAVYSAENPKFFKHLTKRDQLTQLQYMQPFISQAIDAFSKLPVVGPYLKDATKFLGKIAGEPERILRGIAVNPSARKYYFDAVSAAVSNNPYIFIKNIGNLSGEIETELEDNIQPSGWIIE